MSIPFHPLADDPLLEGPEFDALVKSIKKNGLHEEIILLGGAILDGRNRYRACLAAEVEPRFHDYEGDNPEVFVLIKNLHRRHLTPEEKRSAILKAKAKHPEYSNRTIAEMTNTHHTTVGAVCSTGEISQLNKTTGKDGKSRPSSGKLSAEKRAEIETYIKANPAAKQREASRNLQVSTGTFHAIKKEMYETGALSGFGRDLKRVGKKQFNNGAPVKIPEGMTLEEVGRKALALESEDKSTSEAAKAVNISTQSYARVRDVILLCDRADDLKPHDAKLVRDVLREMNETGRVAAYSRLEKIKDEVWGKKGTRRKGDENRLDDFDRAVAVIVQACTYAPKIKIPYLGMKRAAQAIDDLSSAIENLRKFLKHLKDEWK